MNNWYEKATSQPEVPPPSKRPEYLSWEDYEELADSGLRPDREIYVRTYLWHGWNFSRRHTTKDRPCLPLSAKEISNLESLYDLLDSDYWKTWLTKAEIKRELSQFDEAIELTDRLLKGNDEKAEIKHELPQSDEASELIGDWLIGAPEEINREAVMQIRELAVKRDPFVAPMHATGDIFLGGHN